MKPNPRIFGAYDIRGKYPGDINEEVIQGIVKRLPKLLRGRVVVGRDGRVSSLSLYRAVIDALRTCKKPREIIEAGLMTTPMMYFLINRLNAGGGIMVTASHNPKGYNGIKVSGPRATPVSGQKIVRLL